MAVCPPDLIPALPTAAPASGRLQVLRAEVLRVPRLFDPSPPRQCGDAWAVDSFGSVKLV
jgi:hypothetical protein